MFSLLGDVLVLFVFIVIIVIIFCGFVFFYWVCAVDFCENWFFFKCVWRKMKIGIKLIIYIGMYVYV